MKSSNIANSLKLAYAAGISCMIYGASGVGKSETIVQAAKDLGIQLIDFRAVYREAVDLRGIPHVINGKTVYAQPGELPTDGAGFFFLDELNLAPHQTQAACYQLVLERRIGDYVMPPGWIVVAAGNRAIDRGHTHQMALPLGIRFIQLNYEVDLNDWCRWAVGAGVRPEVVAFARFRPSLLHDYDPKSKATAFPTPRGWVFVSKMLDQSPPAEIEAEIYQGIVGDAAHEFTGFLRVFRKLPSPDGILLNPNKADVPTDPAVLFAICTALARRATDANFDRIVTYADRLEGEYSTLLISDAVTRTPALQSTAPFIQWAAKHGTNI